MSWLSIVATALGATIALAGTLLADGRRLRDQRDRDRRQESWAGAVGFAYALDAAHSALRGVARSAETGDVRYEAAGDAVDQAGLYQARERLLVAAEPGIVIAGEAAFGRLVAIRDAVRAGARLTSIEYHEAYHDFAETLWEFRMLVRTQAGNPALTPDDLSRPDWSERDSCARCRALAHP